MGLVLGSFCNAFRPDPLVWVSVRSLAGKWPKTVNSEIAIFPVGLCASNLSLRFEVGGKVFAVDAVCPHMNKSMVEGPIEARGCCAA